MPWQVAAAGLSAIGGLFQQNQNKKMMREQMAWNTKEREASQNFTRAERLAQQGYQTSEREAQNAWSEQLYNQYQSPEALRRQYSEAGLDPALAISGGSSAGSAAGSSGSAPTGASSPVMGVQPPYQNMNAFSQGFGEIANAMKSLADAKKAGMDVKFLEDTYKERVEQLRKQGVLQDLEVDYRRFNNKNVEKAFEKLEAEIKSENANTDVLKEQLEILKKEKAIKGYEADKWLETWENAQENIKSSTSKNYSLQWLADQQGISEFGKRVLYETQANLNRALSRIQGINADTLTLDYDLFKETYNKQKEQVDKGVDMIGKQIDYLEEQIRSAKNRNDWFLVNTLTDALGRLAQLSVGIYSARTGRMAVTGLNERRSAQLNLGLPY